MISRVDQLVLCFTWHHLGHRDGLVKMTSLVFGKWCWLSTGSLRLPLPKDAWDSTQHEDRILRRSVLSSKISCCRSPEAQPLKSDSTHSTVLHGWRQVIEPIQTNADSGKRERNPTSGGMDGKKIEVTSNFLQSPKPPPPPLAKRCHQYYLVQGTQYRVLAPLMSALGLPLPIPADTGGDITCHWRITRKSQAPFLLTIHATDIGATPHLVSSLSKQDFKVIALGTLFLAPVTATSELTFVQGLWARIRGC